MKIVTSYQKPDLDGVACMYAYSEFLNLQGENTNYFIYDEPKCEVDIVCDLFNINLEGLKIEDIDESCEFVITDCNGIDFVHSIIKPEKIVEIIDHHSLSRYLPQYTHIQKCQIDKVGAAATIVAERFKNANIKPSRESAILLFYAIISNSINLKASITKTRDIEICKWLDSICEDISYEKINEIFIKKSKIDDQNLRSEMECEIPITFNDFSTLTGQIEVANLEDFLLTHKEKMVNILKQVQIEKNVDYVFINCVDILNGFIIVIPVDNDSKKFVEDTFGYKFDESGVAKINRIIQRKDMANVLRQKYLNN